MLQPDVDETFAEPLLKKRRSYLPDGPKTASEAHDWVSTCLTKLADRGRMLFNVNFCERLQKSLQVGLCLRTDYSGLGGPEEALCQLARGLRLDESVLMCQRACDKEQHCRRVLMHRASASRPSCVQTDILERIPKHMLEKIQSMHAEHSAVADDKSKNGMKKEDAIDEQGGMFIRRSLQVLMQAKGSRDISKRAGFCVVHNKTCPVSPPVPDDFQGLVCNVSGINCYDFSAMGISKRFLGCSAVPFVVWLSERLLSKEDFFVVECVCGFDDELLSELVRESFDMVCLEICPSMFGLPIARERKYMVFLAKHMCWAPEVVSKGHQQAFEQLFSCQVHMRGDELLRASPELVASHVHNMAQAHEAWLVQSGYHVQSSVMSNIRQKPEYMGPMLSGYVPTLLQSSVLWSFRHRRLVLPVEMLELQGYNLLDQDPSRRSCIETCLSEISDTAIRGMAGNAMHIQCIGNVLAFVLACSCKNTP
ncbi:hypothetical protein AK812_SmicGene28969 [Symbiodinium microadriaticum]|uniref:Uncharacterized protein n=1 Tax=Symbiodinium microadriaticum TaxID=2951 RepID=A0A1Q9D351_SYMMI|nr:hypothetical protein AK812_SmicGene28969 [Symbiodinium microadriaticum]